MKKKHLLAIVSIFLIVGAGVLQLFGYSNGAGVGMIGIASLGLLIYREQALLGKSYRTIREQLRSVDRVETELRGTMRWYGTKLLDYGHSSLKRIKALHENDSSDATAAAAPAPLETKGGPDQEKSGQALRFGRVSTPEVHNPRASESLFDLITSDNQAVVCGVFDEALLRDIPVKVEPWYPTTIRSSLEQRVPDIVVVDEASLNNGRWYGVMSASGTTQLKEIIDAIEWCNKKDVPVYLLTQPSTPQVNSHELRNQKVVQLPLADHFLEEASGAELTSSLKRLNEKARKRKANK